MTYDFYADREDKLKVLEFVFKETDLQIFDLGSDFDQEVKEYKTIPEIESKFDLDHGGQFAVTFQLWAHRLKGKPVFRRINLDPKYVQGHTFRYATEGTGLIQLYFGGVENNRLHTSHIGHFNEKRVGVEWDWKEIKSTSSKLKYYIHQKMAVRKLGSSGILSGAERLNQRGIQLL